MILVIHVFILNKNNQYVELYKTNGYAAVGSSLINKEALILVLRDKIIQRRLLYGTMQTEHEVNTYIDGFIDCMKAVNKY